MNSSWTFTFLFNKKQMLYLNSVEISVTRYSIFFMAQFHLIWHLIKNLFHLWLDEGVPKWDTWSGPQHSERSRILMRKQMPLPAHLCCVHWPSSSRFWLWGRRTFINTPYSLTTPQRFRFQSRLNRATTQIRRHYTGADFQSTEIMPPLQRN